MKMRNKILGVILCLAIIFAGMILITINAFNRINKEIQQEINKINIISESEIEVQVSSLASFEKALNEFEKLEYVKDR